MKRRKELSCKLCNSNACITLFQTGNCHEYIHTITLYFITNAWDVVPKKTFFDIGLISCSACSYLIIRTCYPPRSRAAVMKIVVFVIKASRMKEII